jgi:circadian clock protein KaiB
MEGADRQMKLSNKAKSEEKGVTFRLFVTGDEPLSTRAEENLKKFCAVHLKESFEIEVVDVLKSFEMALENKIFLTPALVKSSPEPAVTIFGDLSDTNELIRLLRSREDK